MKHSILKRAGIAADFLLPGILAIFLVGQYGLLWVCAILALECLQAIATNRMTEIPLKTYDWWKGLVTSLGIVMAVLLYPVRSHPQELGTAVVVLSVVIHFGGYMVISCFVREESRHKMRKPKVACFRYKKYNDIYVSNASFSNDVLLSMLDVFPGQRIIVLIESDENNIQTLSSTGKSMAIAEEVSYSSAPRFSAACDKTELRCLLNRVHVNDLDGMFIASINDGIMANELIRSIADTASSMVKRGMSDISLSINFPENQMIISFAREKYEVMPIKEKIGSIFGG